jgi:hypothetical protein
MFILPVLLVLNLSCIYLSKWISSNWIIKDLIKNILTIHNYSKAKESHTLYKKSLVMLLHIGLILPKKQCIKGTSYDKSKFIHTLYFLPTHQFQIVKRKLMNIFLCSFMAEL